MQTNTIDIADFANSATPVPQAMTTGTYNPIWLNQNEQPLIFFRTKGVGVNTHFRPGQNIICNGDGCILCVLGQRAQKKLLIPAYQPLFGAIGILSVNQSRHPQALLPQLANILKEDGGITLAFIAKVDSSQFTVKAEPLQDGEDFGVDIINAFIEAVTAGQVNMSSIIPTVSNFDLAQAPDIAKMMALKGITVDMP
jgi:hypothetical protein